MHDTTPDGALRGRIAASIAQAYIDPALPQFDFMSVARSRSAHAAVVAYLVAAGFQVEDTTDANEDVAVHLVLRREGQEQPVALSLVGSFSRITPVQPEPTWKVIVQEIFRANGFESVPAHILEEPSALWLDGEIASIDTALFAS